MRGGCSRGRPPAWSSSTSAPRRARRTTSCRPAARSSAAGAARLACWSAPAPPRCARPLTAAHAGSLGDFCRAAGFLSAAGGWCIEGARTLAACQPTWLGTATAWAGELCTGQIHVGGEAARVHCPLLAAQDEAAATIQQFYRRHRLNLSLRRCSFGKFGAEALALIKQCAPPAGAWRLQCDLCVQQAARWQSPAVGNNAWCP